MTEHSGSLQEFIKLITAEVRKMSPDEKRLFRESWLAYVTEKENQKQNDRRFLKSCGINPDT